jgi:surface antigen
MTSELPPVPNQQLDPTHFEGIRNATTTLRNKIGRLAVVGMLVVSGTALVEAANPTAAYADSIDTALANYPDKSMPCEHAPYSATGSCANYDWGNTHTESYNDPSEFSSRGYAYRNCTDWVAYRLSTAASYAVSHSLGNGGDWYNNAPSIQRSTVPAAWDAAVVPATYNAQGVETSYGHVAFVESVNSVDPNNPGNDNITVSEYNHDALGNGDQRTGTASSMGFTEFVDFGVHPAGGGGGGGPTNTGVQMILDGVGDVWGMNSIGSNQWTQETPNGESKIAAGSSGLQMILDSAGQVWARNSIGYYVNGGWTQETPTGETQIAAGADGQQMILDSAGQVWAKNSIGYSGWTQETPSGEVAMSAGDGGLQMILDGAGQVWARNNIGYYGSGGWTQETPTGETQIAAGNNNLQMILDSAGQVWAKTSIGYGSWTQETPAGETKIAAGDNSQQLILDSVGQVWARNNVGYYGSGGWTQESSSGITAITAGS